MSLVDHAQKELELAGLFDADSDYNGMIGKAVVELMTTFANQGHSGMSAEITTELFSTLARYEHLSPITNNPEDWMDVSGYSPNQPQFWQSRRNPHLFSLDGGRSYYDVNDPDRISILAKDSTSKDS